MDMLDIKIGFKRYRKNRIGLNGTSQHTNTNQLMDDLGVYISTKKVLLMRNIDRTCKQKGFQKG